MGLLIRLLREEYETLSELVLPSETQRQRHWYDREGGPSGGGGVEMVSFGPSDAAQAQARAAAAGAGGAPPPIGGSPPSAPPAGLAAPNLAAYRPGQPTPGDPRGMVSVIRQAAIANGLDPEKVLAVARAEGLGTKKYGGWDVNGMSYGAFQLHRGGLADTFQKETGIDPSNPENEAAASAWAVNYAARHGWHPWTSVTGGRAPNPGTGKPLADWRSGIAQNNPSNTSGNQSSISGNQSNTSGPGSSLANYATGNAVPGGISSIEGVHPEFARRIQSMVKAMPPDIAQGFRIISGYRSQERQAEVNPGVTNSHHTQGMAVDTTSDPRILDWVHQHGAQFGVGYPLSSDPKEINHMEPLENGQRVAPNQMAAWRQKYDHATQTASSSPPPTSPSMSSTPATATSVNPQTTAPVAPPQPPAAPPAPTQPMQTATATTPTNTSAATTGQQGSDTSATTTGQQGSSTTSSLSSSSSPSLLRSAMQLLRPV